MMTGKRRRGGGGEEHETSRSRERERERGARRTDLEQDDRGGVRKTQKRRRERKREKDQKKKKNQSHHGPQWERYMREGGLHTLRNGVLKEEWRKGMQGNKKSRRRKSGGSAGCLFVYGTHHNWL